jgi:hypothetical protein
MQNRCLRKWRFGSWYLKVAVRGDSQSKSAVDESLSSRSASLKDDERERRPPREQFEMRRPERGLVSFAITLALVSCNNDKIEVYKIPKEAVNVAMQSGLADLAPPPSNPAQWNKPDGWIEQPLSEMRLGSFKVEGANNASADISVIAFPGEAGGVISNINRWRGQLQLPPLDEDQLSQIIQRIEVDNFPTSLVDFRTAENSPKPLRLLGAVLQVADRTWFVKMTGPPELLEGQRQKFLDFVRSFRFTSRTDTGPPPPGVPGTPKSTNDK